MVTGALFKGTCYADADQAADDYFTSLGSAPNVLEGAGGHEVFQILKNSTGDWVLQKSTLNLAGSGSVDYQILQPSPSFPACEYPDDPYTAFMDGMELGSAVALLTVVAWAFRRIRPGG